MEITAELSSVQSLLSKFQAFRLEWTKYVLSLIVAICSDIIVIEIVFLDYMLTILLPAWDIFFTKATRHMTF
jgi:hypothetical protein